MNPGRKYSKFDNQPFFTLHPEGKPLIINLVENNSFLIFLTNNFRSRLNY